MTDDLFGSSQKQEFWAAMKRGEAIDCPCCERHSQIYRRSLHCSVAMQLIRLYRLGGGAKRKYVHASHLILPEMTGMGDFTKAKYWQLIDAYPSENPAVRSTGIWRMTGWGELFVLGQLSIDKYAHMFNDEVLYFSEEKITIKDALGIKFDYSELMGFTPEPRDYLQVKTEKL